MSFTRYLVSLITLSGLLFSATLFANETGKAIVSSTAIAADAHAAKVNLNKATAVELMTVRGMTATKAKSIVKYRKAHGDFTTVDDLKKVPGFKRIKNLAEFEDQLDLS